MELDLELDPELDLDSELDLELDLELEMQVEQEMEQWEVLAEDRLEAEFQESAATRSWRKNPVEGKDPGGALPAPATVGR